MCTNLIAKVAVLWWLCCLRVWWYFAVFPNVPTAPGQPCTGEDRK